MDKSDFQLVSQRIISTDFTLNQEFTIPSNLQVDLDGKTEIKDLLGNSATVVFSLFVYENKSLDKVLFKIKVVSEGKFSWNSPIEKNSLTII